jgi:formyl-CoA transferase
MVGAGVPAGRIYRVPEMLADVHFAAREAIIRLPHPRWGEIAMQNVFPRLSRTPGAVRSIAPQSVGEHNGEVWGGILGLTADELAALARDGII